MRWPQRPQYRIPTSREGPPRGTPLCLLRLDLVWRKKAQFDEGSGAVAALGEALQAMTGSATPLDRAAEGAVYESLLRQSYSDPDRIINAAGKWVANRVSVAAA